MKKFRTLGQPLLGEKINQRNKKKITPLVVGNSFCQKLPIFEDLGFLPYPAQFENIFVSIHDLLESV
jgi:hypothetical protein